MMLPEHPLTLVYFVTAFEVVEHFPSSMHHIISPISNIEVLCITEHEVTLPTSLSLRRDMSYVATTW